MSEIYKFDSKALIGLTHPGLEVGFINEVKRWSYAKIQVLAHGLVLVRCKNLEEVIHLVTKLRSPLAFGIPIFISELENSSWSEIIEKIHEAKQFFDEFIANVNINNFSIAFKGLRRNFRWLKGKVFNHEFTSVNLARKTAEIFLKDYTFKVNLKNPDVIL